MPHRSVTVSKPRIVWQIARWAKLVLLVCGLTALSGAAAEAQDPQGEKLQKAAERARKLDTVRGAIVSAIEGGDGNEAKLIRENTKDWVPDYNKFAVSDDAALLRRFAESRHEALRSRRMSEAAYKAQACPILKPFLAVSASAERVIQARGKAKHGHVLRKCRQIGCVPAAVAAVEERCDFQPFMVPLPPS
ncbi:MAG TPA: hypothetical protein VF744_12020 [Beijerinckiaceae bacterium]|jgi:hypothetical protein